MPLDATSAHFVSRFSGGWTPALERQVILLGGGRGWFETQLNPALVVDAPGRSVDQWFPTVRLTPERIFQDQASGSLQPWNVAVDLSRWTVARRILSNHQVLEVMVDFWSNLLNVSLFHDAAIYYRTAYDQVIRTHALGSFERLLHAAVTHPAMGLYLDNAASSKDAPNENLGRELLELHTVGVDAGYTEEHVKASARMLTGYRVDVWWPAFRAFYDTSWHDTSPVQVLGFRHENRSADGRAATKEYLSYLARHPATAERLARRLCVRFVSDDPSPAIVAHVARAYLANDTAIKPTLRALVGHADFLASSRRKVRTPIEDYVAAVRALGIKPQAPTEEASFARAMYWQYSQGGQAPYEWPTPDGYPDTGAAWSGAGRVLTSFAAHRDLASRFWPTRQASFPSFESLLPPMPATLAQVIDHLALRMFGRRPTGAVRSGISQLLDIPLTTSLAMAQVLNYWTLRRILSSLLDSPLHMYR